MLRFARLPKPPLEGALTEATPSAGLGDKERVLKLLESGVERQNLDMVLTPAFPRFFFPSLESEARFQAVVRRTGLPPAEQRPGAAAAP